MGTFLILCRCFISHSAVKWTSCVTRGSTALSARVGWRRRGGVGEGGSGWKRVWDSLNQMGRGPGATAAREEVLKKVKVALSCSGKRRFKKKKKTAKRKQSQAETACAALRADPPGLQCANDEWSSHSRPAGRPLRPLLYFQQNTRRFHSSRPLAPPPCRRFTPPRLIIASFSSPPV